MKKKNKAAKKSSSKIYGQAKSPGVETDKKIKNPREMFQHNMKALRELYPELAERILNIKLSNRFELAVNSKGFTNLREKSSGWIYYNHDDPLKDVVNQIENLKLKNARMVIFLGMGLGYELLHYMKYMSGIQKTRYILLIEKDLEVFIAALHSLNLVSVISNPEVCLLVGEDEGKLYPQIRAFLKEKQRYFYLRATRPVYHSSSMYLYRDYYLKALQIFREAAAHEVAYYGNDPYDSLLGVKNMLSNLQEIIANPGINLLKDVFQGRPAVVASTGPSLNKNKHLLRGLEKKALIIAPDASFKILMDMGVKPHLIVSLERGMETVPLFDGFTPNEAEDVYLAACPVIVNEAYKVYPGPRIIVYRNFDHFKWLGIDRGILDIKLSSGNMGFKVAEYLGCDPIILIGQDLAFSREGQTHANGAFGSLVDEIHKSHHRRKKMSVMGNDGRMIETNNAWYTFLKAYEMDLAEYSGTCINSTEGGAFIHGTVIMPFQEAIDKHMQEEFDPLHTIRDGLAQFSLDDMGSDYQKVAQIVENTIIDMRQIADLCSKGVELCEKYKGEIEKILKESQYSEASSKRLRKIEEEIIKPKNQCLSLRNTMQLFFAHIFQSYVIKFEMEVIAIPEKYENHNQSRAEALLAQIKWFAVIGDLANICLESLQKAKESIDGSKFEPLAIVDN